jgi:hypothetical protein
MQPSPRAPDPDLRDANARAERVAGGKSTVVDDAPAVMPPTLDERK